MTTTEKVQHYLSTADMRRSKAVITADALGMSVKTLRNKLYEEGSQYCDLLKSERIKRYKAAAASGSRPRGKVMAVELGYGDENAFYRAFKAWFGVNYSEYQ